MASKAGNLAHHLTTEGTLTTAVREIKYMWPFLLGLGATGYLMLKVGMSITDEDVKNSKFANPNKH